MIAKKQDLIAKLLAKAESTTPEEAEALTEAAEKLMVKFGIDQAMIDARRAKDSAPEPIITAEVWFKGVHARGLTLMAHQVVESFGTMRTFGRSYRGSSERAVVIVGHESDVEQTKVLIESLHLQSIVAMRSWWKTYPSKHYMSQSEGNLAKRQFLASFGHGAAERIREAVRVSTAEQDAGQSESTALVLRDRGQQAQDHIDGMGLEFRTSRSLKGSRHGSEEGRAAGRSANTGGRSVGAGRTKALA